MHVPKNIPMTQVEEYETSVGVLCFVSTETTENVLSRKNT